MEVLQRDPRNFGELEMISQLEWAKPEPLLCINLTTTEVILILMTCSVHINFIFKRHFGGMVSLDAA